MYLTLSFLENRSFTNYARPLALHNRTKSFCKSHTFVSFTGYKLVGPNLTLSSVPNKSKIWPGQICLGTDLLGNVTKRRGVGTVAEVKLFSAPKQCTPLQSTALILVVTTLFVAKGLQNGVLLDRIVQMLCPFLQNQYDQLKQSKHTSALAASKKVKP